MTAPATRVWRPTWPCPVGQTTAILRHGRGDPTWSRSPDGAWWRASRTPQGPVTLRLLARTGEGTVEAQAWGSGASWALENVPDLLGASDDVTGFDPAHPVLVDAWRRYPHWRVPRTGLVLESLVPAILEQKVTGKQASASWRSLVLRYGEPAPGAGADLGLRLAPDAAGLRAVPSWEWLRMGVDQARSRTVVAAARVAPALERTVGLDMVEVERRLCTVPGIGVWTAAEVRQRAHGDADAVSFGDYHVAKDIGWALTGERIDDEALATLLEPYRPHRYRVQVLVALAGLRAPRRGPRMSLPTHLPR